MQRLLSNRTLATVIAAVVLVFAAGAAYANHTNKSDATITLNVKLALLNKLGGDSLHIDVDTDAGMVNLRGMVHKRETKELAETVTKAVSGVKSVDNDLELEAIENNPSKTAAVAGEAEAEVKDAMLETKVRLALVDKLGSDGFRISTEAASGVVTLEFESSFTTARRQEAARIVRDVDGVTKVITLDKK